jgi:2-iminobutanoate/2-iminopropanoate deaminase
LGEAPFHQGVEIIGPGRLLYVSGQLGYEADGNLPESAEDQARIAWENIGLVLASANMTYTNIVRVNAWLSSADVRPASTAARLAALGDHKVAMTTVVVGLLESGWKLEIDCVAAG